jgi:hypothetical protein
MRRILLLLTVALVMAAMMVAMAAPAFADHSEGHTIGQRQQELTAACREDQRQPGVSECTPALGKPGPKAS